ncbi:MAG: hypothetical protein JWQ95_6930 [Sphaerisporangium sp.]|nr:hypothetical protein [Sphaerisporangium sp.]
MGPGGPGEPPIGPDGPPPGPGAPGGPPAAPSGPPRAARSTTVALIVGLFVVVIVTGVLGTIAVLMTRQPDLPLGAAPPRRLATPIHFAPVTGVRAAPCPGAEAVLDDAGTTCYQVAPGVTVTSVVKVGTVAEKDGTYAVRLVLAPESRQKLAGLTKDALNQLLAVVVDDKVVTAPRVTQPITEDSLSIAGLTKEVADALVGRLLGAAGTVTGTGTSAPSPTTPTDVPSTCAPGTTGTTAPNGSTGTTDNGPSGAPATGTGSPGGPMVTSGTPPTSGVPGGSATCPPGTSTPTASGGSPSASTSQPGSTASQPGSMPLVPQGTSQASGAPARTSGPRRGAQSPRARPTGAAARRTPDPRFASCKQANAANYGPYTKGVHEEYYWYVDGDHDGVACERGDIT